MNNNHQIIADYYDQHLADLRQRVVDHSRRLATALYYEQQQKRQQQVPDDVSSVEYKLGIARKVIRHYVKALKYA